MVWRYSRQELHLPFLATHLFWKAGDVRKLITLAHSREVPAYRSSYRGAPFFAHLMWRPVTGLFRCTSNALPKLRIAVSHQKRTAGSGKLHTILAAVISVHSREFKLAQGRQDKWLQITVDSPIQVITWQTALAQYGRVCYHGYELWEFSEK